MKAKARAFTLLEVVLVLVLLTVIGALAVPLATSGFAGVRLRRATDMVLTTWSAARTKAIETGETLQFRFEPSSGRFRVEPLDSLVSADDMASAASGETNPGLDSLSDPTVEDAPWFYEGELPETVVFHAGEGMPMAADSAEPQAERLNETASGGGWSKPILFFADGSTTAASVTVSNDRQVMQRATLRALTGLGRAGDLFAGSGQEATP
ncbi:MAG: hypothetical protein AAGA92_10675 [Planctomycetota bacterium]